MVDKITKSLRKLNTKEKKIFKKVFSRIKKGDFRGLNIMKLKDRDDFYRLRKGDFRVIFQRRKDGRFKIIIFDRRDENTYKF